MPLLAVGVKPAGSKSVKLTLVAVSGPLLVTSIVKVTTSPSSGVASPLARVLTVTRSAAGNTTGVGSSLPPVSPSAPILFPAGSVPLSERSVTTTGEPEPSRIGPPFESTASPVMVTWLFRKAGAPAASGSTWIVNRTANESPTASNDGWLWSMISTSVCKLRFVTMVLEGSDGGVVRKISPPPIAALPNAIAKSSINDRFARSTLPVFSTINS